MSDFAGGFGGACWLGDLSGQVCKPMQDLLPARLHPKLLQNKIPDFQQQGGNAGPEVDANDLVTFHEATPESNESARHRTEFEDVAHAGCMPHQQPIFDSIYNKREESLLCQALGVQGKSHLLKCLTHKYRETGRMVSISATTARAARNLSVFGRTIHSAFGLEVKSLRSLRPWAPFGGDMILIRETDVFIIDEMSMLTHDQLYYVMMRIKSASGYKDMQELLANKLIILTGDLFQLPPVCAHKVTMNDDGSTICKKCHLTSSIFWNETEKFDIEGSVRHNADPAFAQFCNVIRKQIPTQNQIDSTLSACMRISKEEVALHAAPTPGAGADASDLSTVLCTHNRDVDTYNQSIIKRLYGPQVLLVPLDFFANKERQELNAAPQAISSFLKRKGFHKLTHVAIGAPGFLTTNTNTASNGDEGTVVELHMQEDHLDAISVKMNSGEVITFKRTISESVIFNEVRYFKYTFPLMLGYAMTAHKAQGLT
eukprot:CAMPEP_0202365006 /NCGR_PEP_ID=MMETSP1126-20121109/16184_1 /ASSEMBLY_ACC=CAM_ASM_000457 /TAXON_ID=3047 /ORGANISM="Dunaliella tertiolecta, Strain CCMP1320" /LENGTH=484 /DNA_ID=CAMNT_0048959757 /DNA_START=537 /DNA_END=1988 /DNA_ORIENTATION=+